MVLTRLDVFCDGNKVKKGETYKELSARCLRVELVHYFEPYCKAMVRILSDRDVTKGVRASHGVRALSVVRVVLRVVQNPSTGTVV